jgi:hypothetical protein
MWGRGPAQHKNKKKDLWDPVFQGRGHETGFCQLAKVSPYTEGSAILFIHDLWDPVSQGRGHETGFGLLNLHQGGQKPKTKISFCSSKSKRLN